MMIDAHQHFWSLERGDYGWLTPQLAPIYRDFGPADLKPLLSRHTIAATLLVQAAPTLDETRFLLDLADRTPFVAGVIGWVDFEADDAAQIIADLAVNPLLVGLRPMVQDIADDDWMLRPELIPAFEAMERHDLVFDALVLPRHLPRLVRIAARHPGLTVVVDHLAKPEVAKGMLEPWRRDLAAVARLANTGCKLSGLVTEAAVDWTSGQLRPYAAHVLHAFGAGRLLWGSDWPVVNLAGGYDRWRAATLDLLGGLDGNERAAVLGGNARRIYLTKRGRRRC